MWLLFALKIQFSKNFLEAAIAFVHCSRVSRVHFGRYQSTSSCSESMGTLLFVPLCRGCPYFRESVYRGSTVFLMDYNHLLWALVTPHRVQTFACNQLASSVLVERDCATNEQINKILCGYVYFNQVNETGNFIINIPVKSSTFIFVI